MVEHWNDVVEQCEMVCYNSVEQYGGTLEQCGGKVWNAMVEQCHSVVEQVVEQWNSVAECGGTVWNSMVEQ